MFSSYVSTLPHNRLQCFSVVAYSYPPHQKLLNLFHTLPVYWSACILYQLELRASTTFTEGLGISELVQSSNLNIPQIQMRLQREQVMHKPKPISANYGLVDKSVCLNLREEFSLLYHRYRSYRYLST